MIKALEIAFAEMDKEVLARSQEWAAKRALAVREAKKEMTAGKWDYQKLFDIAGGKTWYNVFNGSSMDMIADFVTKNCKAIADKRNANIVAKLTKKGVNEIGELKFHRTTDGFNGRFVFNGVTVEIQTILAGGYNIQCLHQRTLINVAGKKA